MGDCGGGPKIKTIFIRMMCMNFWVDVMQIWLIYVTGLFRWNINFMTLNWMAEIGYNNLSFLSSLPST